jgi:tetratricopeptide (TPR) repeat protein
LKHTFPSLVAVWILIAAASLSIPHPADGYYKTKSQLIREGLEEARDLLAEGDGNRARAVLQDVLRIDPDVTGAHRMLARMAVEKDQWAVARDHLNWLLRREPQDEEALYLCSRLDSRQGQIHRAAALLRILAREGATNPMVYSDLADHHLAHGRREEAAMVLLRGLELTKGGGWLVERAAGLWKERGLYEQALAIWQSRQAASQTNLSALFQQGFLYQKLGEITLARARYDSVLARDPRNPHALYNLALLSRREGDQRAAADHLEALIEATPDFELAYAELARTYLTLGEDEEAKALLNRFLEIGKDPGLLGMAMEALDRLGEPLEPPDSLESNGPAGIEEAPSESR